MDTLVDMEVQKTDYIKSGHQYALDVANNKIDVCRWVRLVCKKYLDDISKQESESFPYEFSEKRALHFIIFTTKFKHFKGEFQGQYFTPQPWQCFLFMNLFGWIHKQNKTRRYRKALIFLPRKNGKSFIAAIIGLYMLIEEHGSEVYCGASALNQAKEVFNTARTLVKNNRDFQEHFGVSIGGTEKGWFQPIYRHDTNSHFSPVSSIVRDGVNNHCFIIDEYHQHKTDDMYQTAQSGKGNRKQPLVFIITTAGTDVSSPCYNAFKEAQEQVEGIVNNDDQFSMLYTLDPDDDWRDFKNFKKSNPNYGVSVYEDYYTERHKQAVDSPRHVSDVKTKNLNVWCNARSTYLNSEAWHKNKSPKTLKDFENKDVYIGVDLGQKKDLCAVVLLFPLPNNTYHAFSHFYLARDRAEDKHSVWEKQGYMTLTEGNITDYNWIEADIKKHAAMFNIKAVCFDPWKATQTTTNLMQAGIPCIEIPQNTRNLSEPLKEFDALIESGKITHDNNSIMSWMIGNVCASEDWNGNVLPTKDKKDSPNKIDGVGALLNALCRALAENKQSANGNLDEYLNNPISATY